MSSSKLSSKLTSSTTAGSTSMLNMGVGKPSGQPQQVQSHPFWWHSRLYTENNQGQFSLGPPAPPGPADNHPRVHPMNSMMPYIPTDSSDSDYSHIYGRLPIPTRGIRKFPAKPLFLSHWEWWIEIHPQLPTKSGKQKKGPKKSQSKSRLLSERWS
jgi:hypothetical protein